MQCVETPAVEALVRLRPDDQELLRLPAWDGLRSGRGRVVLGISANAVAIRLHRACRRFADEVARVESGDVKGSEEFPMPRAALANALPWVVFR